VDIRLTDQATEDPLPEVLLAQKQWDRVRKVLRSRKLLEDDVLLRLDQSPAGIQLGAKAAEQLALHFMLQAPRRPLPPKASVDVGPMAALNGVWVDPVLAALLPYLEQQEKQLEEDMAVFTFLVNCEGFSIR